MARKIRFPSLRQLYEIDTGNPDLDSERSYNFEVGVEQELPWQTRLALTGFQMELYGFIERIGDEPFENRERLRMRGFEVTAASRPWEPLFLRLGYTFLDARDIVDDSPFDELQSRPRHKIDAEARYTFPWGTVGRVAVSYVADTFVYTRNEPFLQGRARQLHAGGLQADPAALGGTAQPLRRRGQPARRGLDAELRVPAGG